MTDASLMKCPGSDPVSKAVPESFACTRCGGAVEIWTDEKGGECPACGTRVKREGDFDPAAAFAGATAARAARDSEDAGSTDLVPLRDQAMRAGATGVAVVSTEGIVIRDELAERCGAPRCENYSLSMGCPPNVKGPAEMRRLLAGFSRAVVFKIDVPSDVLFSSERKEVFWLLHDVASRIERAAAKMGHAGARAFAGGSCKSIFCEEHLECLALKEGADRCRNPLQARPSMSGFGVDVARLMELAGWTMSLAGEEAGAGEGGGDMANVCGLVLVC